ncbi:unnamed protein product [Parascedosporium putredinis]|uniref:DUF6536 domain-containing protein n=1 Tax=Parascedosporium putredinis TaxID=1442378 RepID=A0A9P1MC99_9PEZI|nr:unnamed protein product [Parascedosporium putredinis]CAI7996167.1 unnamed protein product [Parascedosporium putredinis]
MRGPMRRMPPTRRRPSPPASAYKIALVVRIAVVTVVFLFNVIWLVRARVQNGTTGGVGTAHRGTCDAVENLGTRLHVVINVLLVVVLASTTTFMGLACGPTRTEIDAAHRKRQSLGSFHLRGVTAIANADTFICQLGCLHHNISQWVPMGVVDEQFVLNQQRGSRIECIKQYSDVYQGEYRTVLAVTEGTTASSSDRDSGYLFHHGVSHVGDGADSWICLGGQAQQSADEGCGLGASNALSALGIDSFDGWKISGKTVLFCLAEPREEPCALRYSGAIAGLVTVFVFVILASAVCMLVLFKSKERPLICPGEAVESFLRAEDETTKGMSLASRLNVRGVWKSPSSGKMFKNLQHRAWRSTGNACWILLSFSALLVLSLGLASIGTTFSRISGQPGKEGKFFGNFGTFTSDFRLLTRGDSHLDILAVAAIANIPHIVLAVTWLSAQNLATSAFHARDWASFADKAQNLMVSDPKVNQRGLWILGMPWPYGVTLCLLQALLHFLTSQAIFAVKVEAYGPDGEVDRGHSESIVATSPVAMMCALIALVVFLLLLAWIGSRPVPPPAPLVGTCSGAISASCHPTRRPFDMECEALKWGSIGRATVPWHARRVFTRFQYLGTFMHSFI